MRQDRLAHCKAKAKVRRRKGTSSTENAEFAASMATWRETAGAKSRRANQKATAEARRVKTMASPSSEGALDEEPDLAAG